MDPPPGPFLDPFPLYTGPDFKRVLPLGTGQTAAPRCVLSPPGLPTLLEGATKVIVAGNLDFIALLEILRKFLRRDKKV